MWLLPEVSISVMYGWRDLVYRLMVYLDTRAKKEKNKSLGGTNNVIKMEASTYLAQTRSLRVFQD